MLYDPRDASYHTFGVHVDKVLAQSWRTGSKLQVITEAELLPQLLARRCWADRMHRANTLCFIDNEPAKHSLVRGTSMVRSCALLVHAIHFEELSLQSRAWFSRVSSFSNIADGPSRLNFASVVDELKASIYNPAQPSDLSTGRWI